MTDDIERRRPPGAILAELDELEVEVEKLVAGGEGLARCEGVPLFIPRSAPGDRLRIRLVERHTDYGRAEILEILAPGPGRRQPPCRHFARCGGCDLQHLEDALQVRLKAAAAVETLERLGGLTLEAEPEVISGAPFGYRLRAQVHTDTGPEGLVVGYRERRSRRLVPVDECPILAEELERMVLRLPEVVGGAPPRRIDLAVGDGGRLTAAPLVPGLPRGAVRIEVAGHCLEFDARCFFQVHRGLLETLVERVVGEETGSVAVDLYAGVGLFSLPLARRYGRVIAVEGDRIAARFARRNARNERAAGLEVVTQAVESWIGKLPRVDRVVVDPPRRGLAMSTVTALLAGRPSRLTYVSCHPATLARDLRRLEAAFRVERLTIFDLFPQTGHVEVVAQLTPR